MAYGILMMPWAHCHQIKAITNQVSRSGKVRLANAKGSLFVCGAFTAD